MKIDGLTHPKTKELAYTLEVPLPHAIGLLELLWAFVGQQTPQGNIGKWSNAVIAGEAGWIGCADTFVEALLSVGYLDHSDEHRLLVHDWADHCPNWVWAKLKKTGREIIRADLSADLSSDLRGRYKPSQAKPNQKEETSENADAPPDTPKYSPEHLAVAEHMADRLTEAGVGKVPRDLGKWAEVIRLACERDNRTPDQLREVFDWAHFDDFWRANILSASKLREKFDQLALQRQSKSRGAQGPPNTTRGRAITDDLTDTSWAH